MYKAPKLNTLWGQDIEVSVEYPSYTEYTNLGYYADEESFIDTHRGNLTMCDYQTGDILLII